jgi:integrase
MSSLQIGNKAVFRTIGFESICGYKGYLKANPLADIKNMGVKDKRVEFWTIDEYEKFAYQAMVDPEFYYCYEVLYWCGLREGEMLALTRNDIDFDTRTIRVNKTFSQHHGKRYREHSENGELRKKSQYSGFPL